MSELEIQYSPTAEILALCDQSDRLIENYLGTLDTIKGGIRRFESQIEVYTIAKALIRHLEAVCLMARHDLVLVPSAMVVARVAFEASVCARWMFKPIDPFEREVRWVVYLQSGVQHFAGLAKSTHASPEFVEHCVRQKSQYEDFSAKIIKLLLERGYSIPKKSPKVNEMLDVLGEPQLYQFYRLLSAYTHNNFEAGTLYRQNLGAAKEVGEFIEPQDWHLPLNVAWKSFFLVAREFLYWAEADMSTFDGDNLHRDFQCGLERLLKG